MRRRYEDELQLLPETYSAARLANGQALRSLLSELRSMVTVFVGSGGTLAVAEFAAELHRRTAATVGIARTPLEFVETPIHHRLAVVLLSASGRNSDVRFAAAAACRREAATGLVTFAAYEQLPKDLLSSQPQTVTLDASGTSRGFLATSEVLSMATQFAVAYGAGLPDSLNPPFTADHELRPQLLVLYPPHLKSVGIDMETRFHELGLASVQLADLRNVAHGRHVGLQRNLGSTTVVVLADADSVELSERTARHLPSEAHVVRLTSTLNFPASALELFASSMVAVLKPAVRQSVKPSRPGAPKFGRALYSSRVPTARARKLTPVLRKIRASGAPPAYALVTRLEDSLGSWLDRARQTTFDALVLDYDGTCCRTDERRGPTRPSVTTEILRVMKHIPVAFASGRGPSLNERLREWVPSEQWSETIVGLYNGGLITHLSDDVVRPTPVPQDLLTLQERLENLIPDTPLRFEPREHQLTIESTGIGPVGVAGIRELALHAASHHPRLDLRAFCSDHSVDILPPTSSKGNVVGRLRVEGARNILIVGDQGQRTGNDYEMLASVWSTLSVNKCSGDPTRCWNLARPGESGPEALVRYLRALRPCGSGLRFDWRGGRS